MKKLNTLILIATIFCVQNALAVSYSFEPKSGKTVFETKGWPSLITIKGEGVGAKGELTEKDNKVSGQLVMDLSTLKTGISLRDEHMKDKYLEVKKYPKATLNIKDMEIPKALKGEVKFKGELEVHGTKKEIEGTAKLTPSGDKTKVEAEFPIKLSEFKIEIPSYKGITVAEDVKVKFESEVKKAM